MDIVFFSELELRTLWENMTVVALPPVITINATLIGKLKEVMSLNSSGIGSLKILKNEKLGLD